MPIYAYRCASCGHSRDVLQKMSDPVLTTCPACGADQFQKQVTAAGFQLKGSGWYATDFKGGNAPAPPRPPRRPRCRRRPRPPARRAGAAPSSDGGAERLGVVLRVARRRQLRLPLTAARPCTPSRPRSRAAGAFLRKYLFAGLLVWLPLAITVGVLMWAIGLMDGLFHGILHGHPARAARPAPRTSSRCWPACRGLGVVLLVLLLLITGMFVTNMVGAWWLKQWNNLLSHIPIVKSIYVSVKQVSDTLFSTNGNAFREAVMVQYPREGSWTIAFVTGKPSGEVAAALPGEHLSLYVPTTPNPTSGFFLMMPRRGLQAAAHERRRGAEIHHLHGRRRAPGRDPGPAGGGRPQSGGLNAPRSSAFSPEGDPPPPACHHISHRFRARAATKRAPCIRTNRTDKRSTAMRTTYCGLVSDKLTGQTVTLMGWAHRRRDHGKLIFIDLRDREGIVQVVCDQDLAESFKVAESVRNEFCLKVDGRRARARARSRQPEHGQRHHRGVLQRARGAQPQRHAAVPARRREPVGDHAPHAPRAGPAPPADAEEPDAALPRRDGSAPVPRQERLRRHRDPDADQEHARKARATTSCPAACTTATSSRCRSRRSCSSSC